MHFVLWYKLHVESYEALPSSSSLPQPVRSSFHIVSRLSSFLVWQFMWQKTDFTLHSSRNVHLKIFGKTISFFCTYFLFLNYRDCYKIFMSLSDWFLNGFLMTNMVSLPTTCPWLYLTCFWTSCGKVYTGVNVSSSVVLQIVPMWQTDPWETLEVWPEPGGRGVFSPAVVSVSGPAHGCCSFLPFWCSNVSPLSWFLFLQPERTRKMKVNIT